MINQFPCSFSHYVLQPPCLKFGTIQRSNHDSMSQASLFSFRVIESLSRESAQRQVKSLEPFIISGAVSTRTIYTLTSLLKSSVVQLMCFGHVSDKHVGCSHKIALNGFDY